MKLSMQFNFHRFFSRIPDTFHRKVSIFQNRLFLLAVFFLTGTCVGALCLKYGLLPSDTIANAVIRFYSERIGTSVFEALLQCFLSSFPYLLILWLLGLSFYGFPISPFVLLFRGLGFGAICGFFFSHYGFSGLPSVILLFFPAFVLETFILMFCAREAMGFSGMLLRASHRNEELRLQNNIRLYCVRFLILALFLCFSIAIEVLVTHVFSGFILPPA